MLRNPNLGEPLRSCNRSQICLSYVSEPLQAIVRFCRTFDCQVPLKRRTKDFHFVPSKAPLPYPPPLRAGLSGERDTGVGRRNRHTIPPPHVMARLVPAIHAPRPHHTLEAFRGRTAGMAGTSPAMRSLTLQKRVVGQPISFPRTALRLAGEGPPAPRLGILTAAALNGAWCVGRGGAASAAPPAWPTSI